MLRNDTTCNASGCSNNGTTYVVIRDTDYWLCMFHYKKLNEARARMTA